MVDKIAVGVLSFVCMYVYIYICVCVCGGATKHARLRARCHISCLPGQQSYIVDKALNEKVIVVLLSAHGSTALFEDGIGIQFDFKFVYLFPVGRILGEELAAGHKRKHGSVARGLFVYIPEYLYQVV